MTRSVHPQSIVFDLLNTQKFADFQVFSLSAPLYAIYGYICSTYLSRIPPSAIPRGSNLLDIRYSKSVHKSLKTEDKVLTSESRPVGMEIVLDEQLIAKQGQQEECWSGFALERDHIQIKGILPIGKKGFDQGGAQLVQVAFFELASHLELLPPDCGSNAAKWS